MALPKAIIVLSSTSFEMMMANLANLIRETHEVIEAYSNFNESQATQIQYKRNQVTLFMIGLFCDRRKC